MRLTILGILVLGLVGCSSAPPTSSASWKKTEERLKAAEDKLKVTEGRLEAAEKQLMALALTKANHKDVKEKFLQVDTDMVKTWRSAEQTKKDLFETQKAIAMMVAVQMDVPVPKFQQYTPTPGFQGALRNANQPRENVSPFCPTCKGTGMHGGIKCGVCGGQRFNSYDNPHVR